MKFTHELVKIKIKNDGKVLLDLREREGFGKSQHVFDNVVSKKYEREPHPDLIKALQDFSGHLGILCGYYEVSPATRKSIADYTFAKTTATDGFVVKAVGISGEFEKAKLTITGVLNGEYGSITLNAPAVAIAENDTYDLSPYLETLWGFLKDEVKAYLNGKSAESLQLEMFTDDDATTEKAVDNVIAMKAGRAAKTGTE